MMMKRDFSSADMRILHNAESTCFFLFSSTEENINFNKFNLGHFVKIAES